MEIQLVYIVEGYKFKEYKNANNFEEFIEMLISLEELE